MSGGKKRQKGKDLEVELERSVVQNIQANESGEHPDISKRQTITGEVPAL